MKKALLLAATSLLLSACVYVPTDAGWALIEQSKRSGYAMENNGQITRRGRACAQNILGLVAQGDSSIEAARKNGGITKVMAVDYEIESYIVFAKVCTNVAGQ